MGSMRKDYVSERFMIISSSYSASQDGSVYSPGNETATNPSVLSLVAKDGMLRRLQDSEGEYVQGWSVRVVPSSNPIMSVDAENLYGDGAFYSEPAYGYHYIVVASPNPDETFATIDVDQWSNILVVVQDRLKWLYAQKGVRYVAIYADHGPLSGSHNPHPYLNMLTFSTIPPVIGGETESYHRMQNENGVCPMCKIITDETGGPRQILQTDGFIAYCPWSSSYPYEFWISPKKHTTLFSKITQKEINDLSLIIRSTLGGLTRVVKDVSFNMVFHLSPEKKNTRQIHWHIEVYPVTRQWTGLERGYGIFLNDVSPEDAAKRLGAACREEFSALVGIS